MNGNDRKSRGFTLVELIICLVILAILAAVAIPTMLGYVKKTRESGYIETCRQCVLAAQPLASEQTARGQTLELSDAQDHAQLVSLAEVPTGGDITLCTVEAGKVTALEYKAPNQKLYVLYQDGVYTLSATSAASKNPVTQLTLNGQGEDGTTKPITEVLKNLSLNNIDSSCPTENSNALGKLNAQLQAATGDDTMTAKKYFAACDIAYWAYRKSGSSGMFYWSEYDISNLGAGTEIPMLRYNMSSGTYTVWNTTLKEMTAKDSSGNDLVDENGKKITYIALNSETGKTINSDTTKQTYEDAYAVYQTQLAAWKEKNNLS